MIEGADKEQLTLTEKGKYKALVKVKNDNDSWLVSEEIEVTDVGGSTAIAKGNKNAQPKLRKLRHKVDVKGRRAE